MVYGKICCSGKNTSGVSSYPSMTLVRFSCNQFTSVAEELAVQQKNSTNENNNKDNENNNKENEDNSEAYQESEEFIPFNPTLIFVLLHSTGKRHHSRINECTLLVYSSNILNFQHITC